MASPAHRVRQFLAALGWTPTPPLDARRWLSSAEHCLFVAQSAADQHHAVRVACHLLARGHRDDLLVRAALLHDVGKTDGGITILHRVAWVLSGRLAPRLRPWLVRHSHPCAVLADHAAIGASRLRAAGVEERLIALVAGRPLPEDQPRFALLTAADDAV